MTTPTSAKAARVTDAIIDRYAASTYGRIVGIPDHVIRQQYAEFAAEIEAALSIAPDAEPVAWQWRSRIKGGPWDAWESGRYGAEPPPFMEIEERAAPLPAKDAEEWRLAYLDEKRRADSLMETLDKYQSAPAKDAVGEAIREALEWYGEQARLARLIHSGGDAGRHALADDGGKRAREALAASSPPKDAQPETIETYFARQIEWSRNTFGPALRTGGVLDHIRKELTEIEAEPHDLSEWIDVVILAMDGFWRHGGSATDLLPRLLAKQQKNMARQWPDWRTMSEDSAIEHDRSKDAQPDYEAITREMHAEAKAILEAKDAQAVAKEGGNEV